MDDNTFKVLLALIAAAQVVALSYLAIKQQTTQRRVSDVHELVNGQAHEKTDAIAAAARKQGELEGRDYEARRQKGELP